MSVMVLGVGVYGYLIGNIATMMANLDVARAHHQEKMEQVTAFMRYRNIPGSRQSRIRNYYNYLWESRRGYDELSVITDLPDSLKADVVIYLNMEILEKVPIFRGSSDEFIRELVVELCPIVFTPGDFIFRRGELGDRMYFVSKGTVLILGAEMDQVWATLGEGEFFGEMALLFQQPRTASARAADYCDLYYLDRATFDRVLGRYPEFRKKVEAYAAERSHGFKGTKTDV
jgi:voltage-gated potassium channel